MATNTLPLRLESVPPLRLSRLAPLTTRPSQPEIKPLRLTRRVPSRVSFWLLINLPALLITFRATTSNPRLLEISPLSLSRSRRRSRVSKPLAVSKPLRLSRSPSARFTVTAFSPSKRPPFWVSAVSVRWISSLADTSPPLLESRVVPVSDSVPRLLIKPLLRLFNAMAFKVMASTASIIPPSLFKSPLLICSALSALITPLASLRNTPSTVRSSLPRLSRLPPLLFKLALRTSIDVAPIKPLTLSSALAMRNVRP
ncbi:hypothetical protein D3C81_1130510 [compost metagenome]